MSSAQHFRSGCATFARRGRIRRPGGHRVHGARDQRLRRALCQRTTHSTPQQTPTTLSVMRTATLCLSAARRLLTPPKPLQLPKQRLQASFGCTTLPSSRRHLLGRHLLPQLQHAGGYALHLAGALGASVVVVVVVEALHLKTTEGDAAVASRHTAAQHPLQPGSAWRIDSTQQQPVVVVGHTAAVTTWQQ